MYRWRFFEKTKNVVKKPEKMTIFPGWIQASREVKLPEWLFRVLNLKCNTYVILQVRGYWDLDNNKWIRVEVEKDEHVGNTQAVGTEDRDGLRSTEAQV